MKKIISLLLMGSALLPMSAPAQNPAIAGTITKPANLTVNTELRLVKFNPTDVFSTGFNLNATGRSDMNSYLLCYLSTLVYPQYLAMVANDNTDAYQVRMHRDGPAFEAENSKYVRHLFANPVFKFVRKSDRLGYDPEAMVITTATANYVVFRGTDRVGSNQPGVLYDWSEWISTDFDAVPMNTPALTGKVLSGMWKSLEYEGFISELYNYIQSKGGSSKKLWITGHSLGAGQAQLFAMYAAKKGLVAQGIYGFAAPNPGDQQFVTEMDRLFPGNRLQRYEFIDDPITMLSSAFGYEKAGTRVFYKDINNIEFNQAERSVLELAAVIPAVTGVVKNGVTDAINGLAGGRLHLDNLLGGSPMCYHHPTWYLKAAYQQLTAAERSKVPAPLALPQSGTEGCDAGTVKRGKNAGSDFFTWAGEKVTGAVETAAATADAAVKKITFTAGTIISNVTGTAITEGDYYIVSYPSKEKLGLNEQNGFDNASDMRLTTSRSKVKIKRFGAIGYTIEFGTKTFNGLLGSETKSYVLDSEGASLYQSGSSEIQLWEKNIFPLASFNQRWLFINLEGNKYMIKNLENGKVLDANNNNINTTSCGVKTYRPIDNEQTQIWVLEKAN